MDDHDSVVAQDDWFVGVLYGDTPPTVTGETDADRESQSGTSDAGSASTDLAADATPDQDARPRVDANAGAKRSAVVLGAGLACAVTLVVGTLLISGASADPPRRASSEPVTAVPSPTPAVVPPAATDQDQAVAFTASADCPAGSTSAQSLTDSAHDSAWVCVRGPAEAAVDGQVLHVDFGTSHVLTAIAVTPGWVAKTTGGQDEWLQHRVVSRLQYGFNDDAHTIVTQDTGNAHGPVTLPLPRPVLASQVTVIILQTARPPSSPLSRVDPNGADLPGWPGTQPTEGADLGVPDGPAVQTPTTDGHPSGDPVDATFAMSTLQFFGHPPR